jgi:hypothetical protein
MSDFGQTPRKFDIGRVFEHTFASVGSNFPVFFSLAVLLSGLPQAALALAGLGSASDPMALFSNPMKLSLWLAAALVSVAAAFTLQAAIVHGSVVDMTGRKARFADCLNTGFRHFLPVLAISILATLGIMLGFVLLIVPGVILSIMWVVVVPVRVVENKGVFAAFGRSANLTEGSRWMILVLFIVYVVLTWVVGLLIGIIGVVVASVFGGLASLAMGTPMIILQGVISPLISSVTSMIGAAGVAAVYYELRSNKEGVVPESLAAVFD